MRAYHNFDFPSTRVCKNEFNYFSGKKHEMPFLIKKTFLLQKIQTILIDCKVGKT